MRRTSARLQQAPIGRFLLRNVRHRQNEVESWSVEDAQTFFRCLGMSRLADEMLQEQADGVALWNREEPIRRST